MSALEQHSEWLSLIDVSGPFLAEPVLKSAFPQGLEGVEAEKRKTVRQAYDEWREALDLADPDLSKIHQAWIGLVLKLILELDEDDDGDVLKTGDKIPAALKCELPEHGVKLRPDYAVVDDRADGAARMLIAVYEPGVSLSEPLKRDGYLATPAERMIELCRGTGVRLGLVTNGEQWMFVDAPVGGVVSLASWYARLWGQEPVTLQAFVNLLGVRRFFVASDAQLPALLDESLKFQDEVTDALGEQVRRAVEVLIQALDKADVDRQRELLVGVDPSELYEAALTVMMRIVFLLSAEERGLLLLGDERYEANYAVSTLRMQLRAESEEILERRGDAWSRLLSIFRAVYGGIDHEAMRLPALGGSLFDPDRFPFLEGRAKGSSWKRDPAFPLPIDNRTVLYLLDAVQLFEGRTLSYLALDVEQIGYVYEGLLERTVVRAEEATLDLAATKSAKNPWVALPELDDAAAKGRNAVEQLLQERTGSSASRVRNDLDKPVDEDSADKLLTACHADRALRDRVRPYYHFLRTDRWGYPLLYPKGAFMVTTGTDRRETGTHYTPKSLTEAIVKETLEPLVYVGPAEGKPRADWQLKSPAELLDLKICDPAMGSGAFLVQVCRWLSERLVEAWQNTESSGAAVTSDGVVVEKSNGHEPLRNDPEERLLTARRLIAERCLYGVDVNPLAVELAKLSIWLVTLAKGRPFGFLDHSLRCGNSLLGIHRLDQLLYLDMSLERGGTKKLFAREIDEAVACAIEIRARLRSVPIRDIRDVELMESLDEQARAKLNLPELIADALVGEVLQAKGKDIDATSLSIDAGHAIAGDHGTTLSLSRRAQDLLRAESVSSRTATNPLHWPLEFPEVFDRESGGFDALVGNPPFLGGKKISGVFGDAFREYLVTQLANSVRGHADLIAYFFLRAFSLIKPTGTFGLIASNSIAEGDTRDVGLQQIVAAGGTIFGATRSEIWPGAANVATSRVYVCRGNWKGRVTLDTDHVDYISSSLGEHNDWAAVKLAQNAGICFQGSIILGLGFTMAPEVAEAIIGDHSDYNRKVLFPYLIGKEVNSLSTPLPERWVINFWDWPESEAKKYPVLYKQVYEQVKPERDALKDNATARGYKEKWWRFGRDGKNLYHAIGRGGLFKSHPNGSHPTEPLEKIIVFATGATKYPCFTFVDNDLIYANSLCVIASDSFALFACLSSDIHAIWAFEHGSRLHERLRYTHGDIFETFPFPRGVLSDEDQTLVDLGLRFFEARRDYMIANDKGMTKFYNDFHDPACDDQAIVSCRALQEEINSAVLSAYGIDDIELDMGFHQVGYLPTDKNTRFTISEGARDKLLRRLALLNKERHQAESQPSVTRKVGSAENATAEIDLDDLFAAGGRR